MKTRNILAAALFTMMIQATTFANVVTTSGASSASEGTVITNNLNLSDSVLIKDSTALFTNKKTDEKTIEESQNCQTEEEYNERAKKAMELNYQITEEKSFDDVPFNTAVIVAQQGKTQKDS